MQDKADTNKHHIQGIADVFAEFYEELCTSTTKTHEHEPMDNCEQLQQAMTPNTTQDSTMPSTNSKEARLPTREVSRMIRRSTRRVKKTLATTCNKAIKPNEEPPPELAGYQRHKQEGEPIVTIQIPTHLFDPHFVQLSSQLLFQRLQPTLDSSQSADQAVFRPGYSTTDHFFTFQRPRQRVAERHQPLWVAAIDFKKRHFDTVEHSNVWKALEEQGIEEP